MLNKNKLPLLIIIVMCVELMIYLWAVGTTETSVVFDKCARNSGRVSSFFNVAILGMIGFYGLKNCYTNTTKKDALAVLITLFAVNHLIHFFYVYQNFMHHAHLLIVWDNKHGFVTFIGIVTIPIVVWRVKQLNGLLYFTIIAHLFNVSYFIIKTFHSKIKPEHPAYHNQLGIVVTSAALMYVLYGIIKHHNKLSTTR